MAEGKFVLAHCRVTGKHFALDVQEVGGTEKVVNFIDLKESEANMLVSDPVGAGLATANNLIPCRYCGTRKIGGCSCTRTKKACRAGDKYDFQCAYCDQLVIEKPVFEQPKIYVSSPRYDDVAKILDSMGVEYSLFGGSYDCDILFLNCGTNDLIDADELKTFVKNGGCVYASDWAEEFVNAAFPGKMHTIRNGEKCKMRVEVVDPEVQQIVGNEIEVEFDLSAWARIEESKDCKVLLRTTGGISLLRKPIMISFEYGKGIVFYTSFHNHTQASEKEKMLLQVLLLKQMGSTKKISVEEMGSLVGLNISSMKQKFKE